jgi:hypothetical protein
MDGSEIGFCVSPSADSCYVFPNTNSSILGSSFGASLSPLELSPVGIFHAPVLVGLVGGGLFLNL